MVVGSWIGSWYQPGADGRECNPKEGKGKGKGKRIPSKRIYANDKGKKIACTSQILAPPHVGMRPLVFRIHSPP